MLWVLVVGALVVAWIVFEKVFDRGLDELFDGIGRLFKKRPADPGNGRKSSLVMRDEETDTR